MRELDRSPPPPAEAFVDHRQGRNGAAQGVELAGNDQRGDGAENKQQQRSLKESLGGQRRNAHGSGCGGHGGISMLPPGGRAIREPLPETIMVWRSQPFANIASCGGVSKKGTRHGRRPLHQGKPPIDKLSRAFTVRAGPSRLTVNSSACATRKNSPPSTVAYPPGRARPARPARSFVSDLRPQRTIAKPIRRAKRILCL